MRAPRALLAAILALAAVTLPIPAEARCVPAARIVAALAPGVDEFGSAMAAELLRLLVIQTSQPVIAIYVTEETGRALFVFVVRGAVCGGPIVPLAEYEAARRTLLGDAL